ncbi:glycosyltransferase family 2 protein [Lactiplantibacillus songbeiensis]|uniref:Glycosyltransferase family 2 protein n=1 Tax=Lactiplantibacillus songbeiensis TaxID=2559920 RepID=A0ABW4C4G9_9LACO|nr:glycosyltransferase family 2 protein [Lactiplantibacillus songbeiensis]
MIKATVAILLSTYNGEKYLKSQIESIRQQSYRDWRLYIRDDGSVDGTQSIIRDFVTKDNRIFWINASKQINLGVKQSFFELLSYKQANYYMFCDQDDVWLPTKISVTIQQMNLDNSIPQLTFTDLRLVDQNLSTINSQVLKSIDIDTWLTKDNLVFDNIVTGCTVMINDALKKEALPVDSAKIVMHDWWFAIIASQIGQIHFVDEPTILYRQHGDNQVGINANFFNKIKKLKNIISFKEQVKLQIMQSKLAFNMLNIRPSVQIQQFFNVASSSNLLNKFLKQEKYRFKKHTIPGTLALNFVLLFFKVDKG